MGRIIPYNYIYIYHYIYIHILWKIEHGWKYIMENKTCLKTLWKIKHVWTYIMENKTCLKPPTSHKINPRCSITKSKSFSPPFQLADSLRSSAKVRSISETFCWRCLTSRRYVRCYVLFKMSHLLRISQSKELYVTLCNKYYVWRCPFCHSVRPWVRIETTMVIWGCPILRTHYGFMVLAENGPNSNGIPACISVPYLSYWAI